MDTVAAVVAAVVVAPTRLDGIVGAIENAFVLAEPWPQQRWRRLWSGRQRLRW